MFYRIFLQHFVKLMLEKKKKEKKKNRALRNVSEDMLTTQYVGPSERLLGICKEVQVKCPPA